MQPAQSHAATSEPFPGVPACAVAGDVCSTCCVSEWASAQSHAILASWGMSDVYLALADHDEYLALPSQASIRSVQSLVKYCFGRRTEVRPLHAMGGACAAHADEARPSHMHPSASQTS